MYVANVKHEYYGSYSVYSSGHNSEVLHQVLAQIHICLCTIAGYYFHYREIIYLQTLMAKRWHRAQPGA